MNRAKPDRPLRVLVTGSRGKSSVVRFLHAAFRDAGLQAYARITGVEPRQLGPEGTRSISRSSGAHVEEMRWWLGNLPGTTQAIVLENSAITQDLQGLAGHWLRPDLTVLTNVLPDHQEVWGPTRAGAAEALTCGVPEHNRVILPTGLQSDHYLLELLERRRCETIFVGPVSGEDHEFRARNLGLALAALETLGQASERSFKAMTSLSPDKYDFQVVDHGGAKLAMAFSVNDIDSTRSLFESLSWSEDETRLIYNHRRDRPGRFESFLGWLNDSRWREVLVIGDKPSMRRCEGRYLRMSEPEELTRLFQRGERIFGCGNIAGLPMTLAEGLAA